MMLRMPDTDNCFFCEILRGEADRWSVLAEDSQTAVLLNGRQFEIGQCIVIPKRHAPTILELEQDELCAVMRMAQQTSSIMMDVFNPDGILLYQNNGVGSGQEVPHFHLHVVPRQAESDWGFGPPHIARLEKSDYNEKFDHTVSSNDKRATVEKLRSRWPP